MNNSKLFSLINSLNSSDLKQITLFLESGLAKTPIETPLLLQYLSVCRQGNKLPNRKEAYSYCFKNTNYADDKVRILSTHCLRAIEKYLVLANFDKPAFKNQKSLILQKYYRENQLTKLFKSESNSFKRLNGSNELRNHDQIEEVFDNEFENYHYDSMEGRKQELNLQSLIDLSDILYFARKIKLACYAIAHGAVYKQAYKIRDLEETLKIIKKEKLYNHPSIGAYYYGYLIMSNPTDRKILVHYIEYINSVQKNFPKEESRTLYYMAINHCIRNLNKGIKEYGHIGLDLYQSALQSEVLLVDGKLSRFTYRNIAMMAIRSDKYEWAEKFSHDYANDLRKQDRKSAYHFNLALIAFHKKDINEAHANIQHADFKDHLIHLAAKNLQCKIYFEMDAFEAMRYILDTMEIYIRRNKIIGYHKDSYKNTIKYYRKIINANKGDYDKLIKEIKAEKVLLERDWLLEKIGA